jgi:hypothetical protein
MEPQAIEQKFRAALAALVERIRLDRSVLAAILCGSLSHDTVWARSDIDLVLVTIDDKKIEATHRALYADGVNVHAMLLSRAEFRAAVEGSLHNSFVHSFLTKGRLLYTHDETIVDLCARLQGIGGRDTQVQLLRAGTQALSSIYKAHKWLVTRGDLDYSSLWILYAATSLAQIEVMECGLLADREVIPQAMKINPGFFAAIYTDLLNKKKTKQSVQAALDAIDTYVASRTDRLFGLVLDYLREAGEVRSAGEIDYHFKRNYDVSGASAACEYLADERLIGKASTPLRLTKKSTVDVEELAFFYLGDTN